MSARHILPVATAEALAGNTVLVSVKLGVARLVGGDSLRAGLE